MTNARYEWREHTGPNMPRDLRRNTRVDVMRANGSIDIGCKAGIWNWSHWERSTDYDDNGPILAYRLTRREYQRGTDGYLPSFITE